MLQSSSMGYRVPCHCLILMFGSGWKGREDKVGEDKFVEHLIASPPSTLFCFSLGLLGEEEQHLARGDLSSKEKSINFG